MPSAATSWACLLSPRQTIRPLCASAPNADDTHGHPNQSDRLAAGRAAARKPRAASHRQTARSGRFSAGRGFRSRDSSPNLLAATRPGSRLTAGSLSNIHAHGSRSQGALSANAHHGFAPRLRSPPPLARLPYLRCSMSRIPPAGAVDPACDRQYHRNIRREHVLQFVRDVRDPHRRP